MNLIPIASREVVLLNEFRIYFRLKTYNSSKSINSNPEISDLLRKLYNSLDIVELYPSLFIEDSKLQIDPDSGFVALYTISRVLLSDAVTLVRGDYFNILVSSS